MLSIFPSLLSWSELSPFLIRMTLAAVFIYSAYRALQDRKISDREKIVSAVEGIAAILLIIGLWTQAAALFLTLDLIIRLVEKIFNRAFLTKGVNYYFLLLIMAITLLLTGPGIFSIDFPL